MTSPRVLFVCVRNGGKSPMAAGLMNDVAQGRIAASSAGTDPGSKVNGLFAEALDEVGVDIGGHVPRVLTVELVRDADLKVVLGREAEVAPVAGTRMVTWAMDEPSTRGVEGVERMRLVRDDLAARVRRLADELAPPT